MRTWFLFLLAVLLLAGCATSQKQTTPRTAKPQSSGFASADAKNVHDFLIRYQTVIAGEDEKAILRLYVDGARLVPYLIENKRVLTKKDLEARLTYITKMQRRAGMRLTFREPMDIKVSISGERANVEVLADLVWQEGGKPHHTLLDCYFRLERIEFQWKIKESHQDVATAGQTVPGKGATPAVRPGSSGGQFSDTPQHPIVPNEDNSPKPLF